jgi:hypothetical protein
MITLDVCGAVYRAEVSYGGHYFRWDFTRENAESTRHSIAMAAHSADTPFDWMVAGLLIRLIRENVK